MAEILDTIGSVSALHAVIGDDSQGTAPIIIIGRGNPNGSVFGFKGQMYIDLNGAPGKVLYVKETPPSGVTQGGWIAK